MIGTSPRGPVQRSQSKMESAQSKMVGVVYERQPAPALPSSGFLYIVAGWEVV
ncbi:unnamed protein product, partial [Staurois parvus]